MIVYFPSEIFIENHLQVPEYINQPKEKHTEKQNITSPDTEIESTIKMTQFSKCLNVMCVSLTVRLLHYCSDYINFTSTVSTTQY